MCKSCTKQTHNDAKPANQPKMDVTVQYTDSD